MINYNKWKDYNDNLLATDKRFKGNVLLCFEDGSHCTFINSFYIEEKEELIILTEHCGTHIIPKASLNFKYYVIEEDLPLPKKLKDDKTNTDN